MFREWAKSMSGAVFDTLAATGALREAEFGERQAETIASVVRRAVDTDRGEFATKAVSRSGSPLSKRDSRTVCWPPCSPLSRPTPSCAPPRSPYSIFHRHLVVPASTLPRSAHPADAGGRPIREAGQLVESDLPPFVPYPQTVIPRAEGYGA